MRLRYINRIGVELEGGWNYTPPSRVYGDGSVTVSRTSTNCRNTEICTNHNCSNCEYLEFIGDGNRHAGEVGSEPLRLKGALAFLDDNYPTETNESCGFHIHISLKNNHDYSRLMDRAFYSYLMVALENWGNENNIKNPQFWTRLEGENYFCKGDFIPDEQSVHTERNYERYTILNYSLGVHGTLELRVLPMFKKVGTAKNVLEFYVKTVERYLSKSSKVKIIGDIRVKVSSEDEKPHKIKAEVR